METSHLINITNYLYKHFEFYGEGNLLILEELGVKDAPMRLTCKSN